MIKGDEQILETFSFILCRLLAFSWVPEISGAILALTNVLSVIFTKVAIVPAATIRQFHTYCFTLVSSSVDSGLSFPSSRLISGMGRLISGAQDPRCSFSSNVCVHAFSSFISLVSSSGYFFLLPPAY
jgi:hypothetical protein